MQNSFTRVQRTNSQSPQPLHYIAINDYIDIKSGTEAGLLGVAFLSDSCPPYWFIVDPQQLTLVEQPVQRRQPPKQLNSFDHPGHFICADQLGFCEK
jgi:hypothetical protein